MRTFPLSLPSYALYSRFPGPPARFSRGIIRIRAAAATAAAGNSLYTDNIDVTDTIFFFLSFSLFLSQSLFYDRIKEFISGNFEPAR